MTDDGPFRTEEPPVAHPEPESVPAERPEAPRKPPPIPGALLDTLEGIIRTIEEAKSVPLSSSAMVNREELIERLEGLKMTLPDELRAARWMVRERETYISRTNEKAREVLSKAKARSEQLISESYIVEEAVAEANTLVRDAEAEARRLRLEAEDFVEQRLSQAEAVLSELLGEIQSTRAELFESRPAAPEPPISQ